MSVVKFELQGADEYSESKEGVTEYRVVYQAVTDNPYDDAETVKAHPNCPARWSVYASNTNARCVSRRATQDRKHKIIWEVECFYTTDLYSQKENPLERPPVIDWDTTEYQIATLTDLDGKPFVTTAGEPISEVYIEATGLIANVSVSVPQKPRWFREYAGAINSGSVRFDGESFERYQLRVSRMSCSRFKVENGIPFRELSFKLQHSPQGWRKRLLNRGFYEIVKTTVQEEVDDGAGGTITKAKTKNELKKIQIDGTGAVEPQLITKEGGYLQIQKDGALDPEKMKEIVVLDFKVRNEVDFGVLPLKTEG